MASTYSQGAPNRIKINWPKGTPTGPAKGLPVTPLGTPGSSPAPLPGVSVSGPGVAPAVMPQPFDPNLELQKLQAGFNIGLSEAEGTYQTGRTGYLTGYNAQGARDYSNPYAQAQLLEDEYKRSKVGTGNSYAAQGQLYSSALTRAQGRNDRLYAQSSAGLRDQASDQYHQIGVGRLQTYAGNAAGVNQAGFDSLRKSVYGG